MEGRVIAMQQEPGNVKHEIPGEGYGGRRDDWQSPRPLAGSNYRSGQEVDDAFIEALTQRLMQRIAEANSKTAKSNVPSPRMRLSLAVVSLIALIAILGATLGITVSNREAWVGLIVSIFVCVSICIINIVFNISGQP